MDRNIRAHDVLYHRIMPVDLERRAVEGNRLAIVPFIPPPVGCGLHINAADVILRLNVDDTCRANQKMVDFLRFPHEVPCSESDTTCAVLTEAVTGYHDVARMRTEPPFQHVVDIGLSLYPERILLGCDGFAVFFLTAQLTNSEIHGVKFPCILCGFIIGHDT